jgi:hypothetical protein
MHHSVAQDRARRIDDLVIDGLLTDLHVAQARIADLEAELRWACDFNVVAVTALRKTLVREKHAKATIRRLMGLPRADPYDSTDEDNDRGEYGEDEYDDQHGRGRAA